MRETNKWFKAQQEEELSWLQISAIEERPEKKHWQLFLQNSKDFLPPNLETSVILDVGCGPDGLIFYYPKTGTKIGIDPLIDSYMLHYDIHKGNLLVKGLGEYLPFRDGSVDAVFCNNALDHMKDPLNVLREICRVLRRGGFLLLDVNTQPLLDRFSIEKGLYQPMLNEYHPHKLISKEIILNLEQIGFNVAKKRTHVPMPWLHGLMRVLLHRPILNPDRIGIFQISSKSLMEFCLLRTMDLFFYPFFKLWFTTELLVLVVKR